MRTSNAELLAEIDTLKEMKRVDASELEVVKYIELLEKRFAIFKVSTRDLDRYFSTRESVDRFMDDHPQKNSLKLVITSFSDV